MQRSWPCLLPWLCGCAAPVAFGDDLVAVLQQARHDQREVVVYFALPGREISDRMEATCLHDPMVLAALRRHDLRSVRVDGFERQALYTEWIGGGEGMGICVLDRQGQVLGARPGPQDPPELAAYLDLVAMRRDAVARARSALAERPGDGQRAHELGCLLLELGVRKETEALLVTAAQRGVLDAHHRLARLCALDGRLTQARRWLRTAPPSPAAQVTTGYLLYKERQHQAAADVLLAALQAGGLGDDEPRARLFYGKALHEAGRDGEAVVVLEALARDCAGSTFAGAALHTLYHIRNPDHGHRH